MNAVPGLVRADCRALIGSCRYYQCREREQPCGPEGYALRYGYKYCSASAGDPQFGADSPDLRAWADRAARCLQEKVESIPETSACQDVLEGAIGSHTECYVGAGFCALSFGDQLEVLRVIGAELFHPLIFKQVLQVRAACENESR